jgi:cysteine-rich repeat protein
MQASNRYITVISFVLLVCSCAGTDSVLEADLMSRGDKAGVPPDSDGLDGLDESEILIAPDLVNMDTDVVQTDEASETCQLGSGCFGDPCQGGTDCLSGLCIDHMGDQICSTMCVEECPPGFACKEVNMGGSDPFWACISEHPVLCRPCTDESDCTSVTGQQGACVVYPDQGRFCASSCTAGESSSCPLGFTCDFIASHTGVNLEACGADNGTCPCSETAIALALSTPCEFTNDYGTCTGQRTCQEEGLTDCDASIPSAEVCNGSDDNCNGETDEATCDDSNPCTQDGCVPAEGCLHQKLTGDDCDDGDDCTLADHCSDGVCGGEPVACNDGNPCTEDLCDGDTGCKFINAGGGCNDDNPCTFGDYCADGACQSGPLLSCDDGNPCTTDSCDDAQGCLHEPSTGTCDDGNLCTIDDVCAESICKPGGLLGCNDDSPCTNDWCDPQTGCQFTPNSAACDDGSLCSLGDHCEEGECIAGTQLDCNDSNGCTNDTCNPLVGCKHTNNTEQCNDQDPCTSTDQCIGGSCIGTGAADCNDDNPCTTDFCDPMAGCTHIPATSSCDDGNPCSWGDKCQAGSCIGGQAVTCDDGNVCTDDSCSPDQGCVHTPNKFQCDDLNACTTDDHCDSGQCISDQAVPCQDDNPCTTDICLPQGGCQFVPNSEPCNDGDMCTSGDVCKDSECLPGMTIDCNDGNPCTTDSCQSGLCQHTALAGECDDDNPCTLNDTCLEGGCKPGVALNCNDDNICTTDYCDPQIGCVHSLNTAPCDDDNACTSGDTCELGECKSGNSINCDDGNPCTQSECANGSCVHAPKAGNCDDNNACTSGDHCDNGLCVAEALVNCNDSNICTNDACVPKTGCINLPTPGPCDDLNACTTDDTCTDGTCLGGPSPICEDDNDCTDNQCEPDNGCVYPAFDDNTPCDDQSLCTQTDSCQAGICTGANPLLCDDLNQCTNDFCNADSGCVAQAVDDNTPCDDQSLCTQTDTCHNGQCSGAEPLDCDDAEACTIDTCEAAQGCLHTPIAPCCGNSQVEAGEECDDGNQTDNDGCSATCQDEAVNSPECQNYTPLTGGDRHISQNDGNGGVESCDSGMGNKWYRFQGAAGIKMPTTCPSKYSCGTDAPGWMQGNYPNQNEGIVNRTVCYHWDSSCCKWSNTIQVRNCGLFYVFKLPDTPNCSLKYCGAN